MGRRGSPVRERTEMTGAEPGETGVGKGKGRRWRSSLASLSASSIVTGFDLPVIVAQIIPVVHKDTQR